MSNVPFIVDLGFVNGSWWLEVVIGGEGE